MLIIKKQDNLYKKLKNFVSDLKLSKKPIFVFDIHKTTLTKQGLKNKEIETQIKDLLDKNYNIFFLSYDGQEKRIHHNYKLIQKIPLYRNIPTIFIMKRTKHLVLLNLVKLIKLDQRYKIKATLIDDNPLNIKDMNKLDQTTFNSILYKI